ncbi:MAG: pyridoxal kinase PdxY [Treponema sp.]|nr:pyridoxal kinase PdxY [Treponema sp.]
MAVLSIQSHVVYGYAGNTAAVFPLQRLGREVWAINTVEFSNHTGYGAWKGKILGAQLISDLVTGLEERGVLNRCEAVLSGYLGDAAAGRSIADAVLKIKKYSPNSVYCCDPVMGDHGRGFYVKPDIPSIISNELIPLADITCPNQFELEALTGHDTGTITGAVRAINALHEMGPSIVLVTSYKKVNGEISMLASNGMNIYIITTPEILFESIVAGTGDMTAAVFLSRYLETGSIEETLEMCAASVYGVLEASFRSSPADKNTPMELKIISAQNEFITPTNIFKAVKIKT